MDIALLLASVRMGLASSFSPRLNSLGSSRLIDLSALMVSVRPSASMLSATPPIATSRA